MKHYVYTFGLVLGICSSGGSQDAPVPVAPCQRQACGIVIEWETVASAQHVDRRYGPISSFPVALLARLQAAGYRFTTDLASVQVVARVFPRLVKAACDVVTGTGSRDECTTIGEVRVEFEGPGERPKSFRVAGRCAGEGEYMTVTRFSSYVAEMFDYYLSPEKKKRPSSRC